MINYSAIQRKLLRAFSLGAVFCALVSRPAFSADVQQTFFVPLPEDQVQKALKTLHPITGMVVTSVTSAVVVGDDTIVTYDQWEDGYEADLEHPTQGSTRIWGDGNPANGNASADGLCRPAVACKGDVLKSGATFTFKNDVQLPRDPTNILWDGRDRIGADKITAVTRAAWAVQPGPVLGDAIEVYPTQQYGLNFELPLGENTPLPEGAEMFEYVDLMIMAGDEATVVTIDPDGPNGAKPPFEISLSPGEGYHTNGGVQMGAAISATNPIQTHIITGNIGANYESRWFTLYTTSLWGSSVFTPVGSAGNSEATYVFLYNPSTNGPIQIDYETQRGDKGTIDVASSATGRFQMPDDSGAQFSSRNGEIFFGLSTIGVNMGRAVNEIHDWGFSLIPERNLTTQAVVAWGPGSDPSQPLQNGNPLWITAIHDTTVYIDWNGDRKGDHTAPNGDKYDQAIEIGRLQSVTAMAPDLDNTAARLFTTNGAVFTAAWGQDMRAQNRNPYLDMGTTVLPIEVCGFTLKKGQTLPSSAQETCCLGMGRSRQVQTQTGDEIVASVIRTQGETMVDQGANYVPAVRGMGLQEGQRAMALEGSRALLLFANGCGYQLEPNEILKIGAQSPCCLAATSAPSQTAQSITQALQAVTVPQAVGGVLGASAIAVIIGTQQNNKGGGGVLAQQPPISQ